jgi:hypothetical protein
VSISRALELLEDLCVWLRRVSGGIDLRAREQTDLDAVTEAIFCLMRILRAMTVMGTRVSRETKLVGRFLTMPVVAMML